MCQHLASTINTCLAESTFALTLVCVVWSSVGSRLVWATHGLPFRAPVYRGVSCLDPPVCLRVQDDPEAKSQPIVVLVGVLRSCDDRVRVRVRGREKRVCVQLRVLTPPARLEALFKLSVVFILSHLVRLVRTMRTICTTRYHPEFAPNFLRVYPQDLFLHVCPQTRHLVRDLIDFPACRLQCRNPSCSR